MQGSQCYDNLWLSQKLHGIHTGKEKNELISVCVKLISDQLAARRIAAHRITALMVIFVQLHKRHLLQRKDQAVSSGLLINQYPRRFARGGISRTVDF